MKRRYLTFVIAVFLSLAMVLTAGVIIKAVLRPLGLYEGTDPVRLLMGLIKDGELRKTVYASLSTRRRTANSDNITRMAAISPAMVHTIMLTSCQSPPSSMGI